MAHPGEVTTGHVQGSLIPYMAGAFMTVLPPIPSLGFSGIDSARLDLPASGEWIDKPSTVMAFSVVCFSLLALSKWRYRGLPASQASSN